MLNLLKLALMLSASYIVDPSTYDPDVVHRYDGNLVGLCDSHRKELLPPQFSRIDYLGHGLFMAWSANSVDKYQYGTERLLFNRSGKLLKVDVPAGTKLAQVLWLGAAADKDPDLELSELPPATLLRVSKDHQFGVCNLKGEEILPINYGCIGKAIDGKAFVTDNGSYRTKVETKRCYLFDCAQGKLKELPLNNVIGAQNLFYSEGLAAFKQNAQGPRRDGYIDEKGART